MKRTKIVEVEENGRIVKKDISFLQNISLKGVESIELLEDTLILNLKNGNSIAYNNIHGTWGFPTIITY